MSQDTDSLQATGLTWPQEAQLCFPVSLALLLTVSPVPHEGWGLEGGDVMGGSQPKGEEQGIP